MGQKAVKLNKSDCFLYTALSTEYGKTLIDPLYLSTQKERCAGLKVIVSPASSCITDMFVHKQVVITLHTVTTLFHTKASDRNLAPFSKYHTAERKAEYVTTPRRTTVTITAKKKKNTELSFSVITILIQ